MPSKTKPFPLPAVANLFRFVRELTCALLKLGGGAVCTAPVWEGDFYQREDEFMSFRFRLSSL